MLQSGGQALAVVGTGYVGLVTGACLAGEGHRVVCLDIDAKRVESLSAGAVPFWEPGLPELVAAAAGQGRLAFTLDPEQALAAAQAVFIAVGTPPKADGSSDLGHVRAALRTVSSHAGPGAVVVVRSTVPPGTGDRLQEELRGLGRPDLPLVNAPEFLAEGTAVRDFQSPDRLVFGGPAEASQRVAGLFASLNPRAPRILTDRPTAELAKYAANTFLAARVSLINEMARLCDAWGADVRVLAQAVGLDARVGPLFLRPGIGYGGSCFPKDVQSLAAEGRAAGVPLDLIPAVEAANDAQVAYALATATRMLDASLAGKQVALWGIAFKPGTDDVRMAPSLRLAQALLDAGAQVRAHDPTAHLPQALRERGAEQAGDPVACAQGADLVLLCTEWPAYRQVDPGRVAQAMRSPRLLDGRNHLDHAAYRTAGFKVRGIGVGLQR
ncbi:MAG: UDP-glucose/GDP-mannose dehydrogenase family protein [Thermoplasmatota archaeon]